MLLLCLIVSVFPSRDVPCQGLSRKTGESSSTIPRAAHLKVGNLFLSPGLHTLPYTSGNSSLGHGTSNPTRDPLLPVAASFCAMTPHPSSARPASGNSTDPAISSPDLKKGVQGFVCFFCSGGAASLPSTATVTSNSVLPRRCLLSRAKIRHGIRPIMRQQCTHLAHRKTSCIPCSVDEKYWLCPACSLPTTSIPTLPIVAMINNTHAPTVSPRTTNMTCPVFQITLSSTPLPPSLMLLLPTRTLRLHHGGPQK